MSHVDSHSVSSLEKDLSTASHSGAITAGSTLLYYLLEPASATALQGSVFFVMMIALGTFTFSMLNLILDRRKAFSEWLSQTTWSLYSVQAGVCVLLGLGVLALAETHIVTAVVSEFAITVVYMTMVGVVIWFAQETMKISER